MRVLAPIFPTLLADVDADEGLARVTLARRSADQGLVLLRGLVATILPGAPVNVPEGVSVGCSSGGIIIGPA